MASSYLMRRRADTAVPNVFYSDESVTLWHGDALNVARTLPDGAADCIVTSPPYFGLRDYGVEGQYGLEESPAEYVETMRALFAELRRVLADDGTLWLNLGDSYANPSGGGTQGSSGQRASRTFTAVSSGGCTALPAKNLIGIPWRVAFALQDDGWTLRNAIVWHKPNAMPESVTDRLGNRYEHLFLLSKSRRYWFDLDAIREPQDSIGSRHEGASGYRDGHPSKGGITHRQLNPSGKNPGDVWTVPTSPFTEAHFAVYPPALVERCVLAGCKPGGVVLDPFSGSGTTGLAATKLGRRYVGIDINAGYLDLSLRTRLAQSALTDSVEAS